MSADEDHLAKPRRGRPARGSEVLSRERILRAALQIVDNSGLSTLTMRRLATELGVDPMAVYRHLPGKEGLHDALIDAVMAEFRLPEGFSGFALERGLELAAQAYLRAVMHHPATLPILMTRPFLTPGALITIEGLLAFLSRHGFDPAAATQVVNVVSAYVLGTASSWASHLARQGGQGSAAIPWESLDVNQVPHLLQLAQTTGGAVDFEGTFASGLRWIIAGIVPEAPGSTLPDRSP